MDARIISVPGEDLEDLGIGLNRMNLSGGMRMKRLAVLLANGFEDIEALTVVDFCRRGGIEVETLSIEGSLQVKSAHEVTVMADGLLKEARTEAYDAVYLPGGLPGANYLNESQEVMDFIKALHEEDKLVAALCAAPLVFDTGGLLREGKFTCYPGFEGELKTRGRQDQALVKDGRVWTGMGPMLAPIMAYHLIEALAGQAKAQEVREETLLPDLKKALESEI